MTLMRLWLFSLLPIVCLASAACDPPVDCETLKQEARAAMSAAPTVDEKITVLREFDRQARAAGCLK
jgi:hypothetical protein